MQQSEHLQLQLGEWKKAKLQREREDKVSAPGAMGQWNMHDRSQGPVKSSTKLTYNMRGASTVLSGCERYAVSQSRTYAYVRMHTHSHKNVYKAVCSNIYEDKAKTKATCVEGELNYWNCTSAKPKHAANLPLGVATLSKISWVKWVMAKVIVEQVKRRLQQRHLQASSGDLMSPMSAGVLCK